MILILVILGVVSFFLYNYIQQQKTPPPPPPPPPPSDECSQFQNSYRDDNAKCCKCNTGFTNYNYTKSVCSK